MMTTQKSLRVLIVDDNRDGADALGLLLEELGHQVHVTYSGMQALDVAATFRADLMLVDLVMPNMDGCRLAARFRQIPMFTRTKIVALTGQKDVEHKAQAQKAGFDAFVVEASDPAETRTLPAPGELDIPRLITAGNHHNIETLGPPDF